MSSTDAAIIAAQDLIHALQNPEPAIPILTLENSYKEAMRSIEYLFGKATPPTIPLRVPVRGAHQEKLTGEPRKNPNKKKSHSKGPLTNAKPLKAHIVESYPEEPQQVHPAKENDKNSNEAKNQQLNQEK